MRTLKRLALLAVVSLSFSSFGQNYLGVHSSNFGGVMATDLQPASFVDGRFKVDINLASFNFGLWNNAAYFDSGDMPKWWVKSFKQDDFGNGVTGYTIGGSNPHNDWILPDSTFADRYVVRPYTEDGATRTLGIYNNVQVDVLNFHVPYQPKNCSWFCC